MMKYNKIVNESDIKNKNTFLIACVCSIVLLLTMCYFGVNSNIKGTAAAETCTCTLGTLGSGSTSNKCFYTSSTNLDGTDGWACTLITTGGPDFGKYSCIRNASCSEDSSEDKITCEAGYYWNGPSSKCLICPLNSYCGGVTVDASNTGKAGLSQCPSNSTSDWSSVRFSDCKCNAGYYLDGIDCVQCPSGTTSPAGSTSESACEAETMYGCFDTEPEGYTCVYHPNDKQYCSCVKETTEEKKTVVFFGNGTSDAVGNIVGSSTLSCTPVYPATSCDIESERLPSATRNGYTFKGWGTSSSCTSGTTSKITLENELTYYYACWVKQSGNTEVVDNNLYVEFNLNNGSLVSGSLTDSCKPETGESSCSVIGLPKATRNGYTFMGWGTSASCVSGHTTEVRLEAKNTTYYACWQKVSTGTTPSNPDPGTGGGGSTTTTYTYKATFNANGGTLNGGSSKSCTTSGSSCSISDLPTASKSGYTFKGWGRSSSCTSGNTSSVTLSEHTTFYACYTNNSNNNDTNVDENPKTGEITMALVWFAGIFAIAYSVYYFKQVREN